MRKKVAGLQLFHLHNNFDHSSGYKPKESGCRWFNLRALWFSMDTLQPCFLLCPGAGRWVSDLWSQSAGNLMKTPATFIHHAFTAVLLCSYSPPPTRTVYKTWRFTLERKTCERQFHSSAHPGWYAGRQSQRAGRRLFAAASCCQGFSHLEYCVGTVAKKCVTCETTFRRKVIQFLNLLHKNAPAETFLLSFATQKVGF